MPRLCEEKLATLYLKSWNNHLRAAPAELLLAYQKPNMYYCLLMQNGFGDCSKSAETSIDSALPGSQWQASHSLSAGLSRSLFLQE